MSTTTEPSAAKPKRTKAGAGPQMRADRKAKTTPAVSPGDPEPEAAVEPQQSEHDAVVAALWEEVASECPLPFQEFAQVFEDAIPKHGLLTWPDKNPDHWGTDVHWYKRRATGHLDKGELSKFWADIAIARYLEHSQTADVPAAAEPRQDPAPVESTITVQTAGPFGLAAVDFNCRVVDVKAPAERQNGNPVGQLTSLKLVLTARPRDCGSIIRDALFRDRFGQPERRSDIKSVSFGHVDNRHNLRIFKGGTELLLCPEQISLGQATTLDGQLLGPEAHLVLEVHGLPRSYAAGYDADHDWYTPAFLIRFEPKPERKSITSVIAEGQTGIEDFTPEPEGNRPELPTIEQMYAAPDGFSLVIGTHCWRRFEGNYLDLRSEGTTANATDLIQLISKALDRGDEPLFTMQDGAELPDWAAAFNAATLPPAGNFDSPDEADA
jgi:hypothetical protein